jgi:glucose/mannose transport system permease protein
LSHSQVSTQKTEQRQSFLSKHAATIAVLPVFGIALFFYFGSALWSVVMSFTASKFFPDYTLVGLRQYNRLANDDLWGLSLQNLAVFGLGSLGSLLLGFVLAVLLDESKVRGEGFFRTVYLYPMAVSLIITGLVWQWLFNPGLGLQQFFRDLGFTNFDFNWVADKHKVMYAVIMASIWQSAGFFMVLCSAGLKGIDAEVWQASKIDGIPKYRMYLEVIIPMMGFTFLTSFVLLSIGAVKAYDIIVAMTNGGPGGGSTLPAYYIVDAYINRRNIALGAAGSTVLLLIVAVFLIALPLINMALNRRRA